MSKLRTTSSSRTTVLIALGSLLVVAGIILVIYGQTELSIIPTFGGETFDLVNYWLANENHYTALLRSGLISVISGIALVSLVPVLKRRKNVTKISLDQQEMYKKSLWLSPAIVTGA